MDTLFEKRTGHIEDKESFGVLDGLFTCKVCGASEAELTSQCPEVITTAYEREMVIQGELDYRGGKWVK